MAPSTKGKCSSDSPIVVSKKVTIFIDLEGVWEVPHRANFDFFKSTETILYILKNHEAKAVFNIRGIIAHDYPELVKTIHEQGHEIAIRGYTHENFIQLSSAQVTEVLSNICYLMR